MTPEIAERTGLPKFTELIRRCNNLFGNVARLGKDTPVHQDLQRQIDISLGCLPDRVWKTSRRSPKKQVAGSDSLGQQSPTW